VSEAPRLGLFEALARGGEHFDDLLRLRAEVENVKKRAARDQAALVERANANLFEALLPILDDLDRAQAAAAGGADAEQIAKGVDLVSAKLTDALRRAGIEHLAYRGDPFAPGSNGSPR
jgi:molecular chaperone GrpE